LKCLGCSTRKIVGPYSATGEGEPFALSNAMEVGHWAVAFLAENTEKKSQNPR